MDNYGNRNKYQNTKNQSKNFRNVSRSHDDEMHQERERNDDYYTRKSKKPDQCYQQQQQQQNPGSKSEKNRYERSYDNRQSRQGSEPRNNNYPSNHDSQKNNYNNVDRNRDTRSSEPGGNNFEHRNKPPSGQVRSTNPTFSRLPNNIDILPPRLKRKYLIEAGYSEDLLDKPMTDLTQQSYSNTLPTGRGGRNNRYDQQNYHQQNYQNSYQSKYNNQNRGYQHDHHEVNNRSLTPPPSKGASRQQQQQHHQKPPPPQPRFEWKSNDIQRREDTSPANNNNTNIATTKVDDINFDWSEDVLNSQSLPHEVNSRQEHHRNRNSRRRNRRAKKGIASSSNGSVERSGYNSNDNYGGNFKMPFPKSGKNHRQRRNSQSSYNSRENSMERGYGYGSRENSLDRRQPRRNRYNGRRGSDYQSSRENSTERYGNNNWQRNDSLGNLRESENQSWRGNDDLLSHRLNMSSKTDQKIAELTKEFANSVELNKSSEQRTLFDPKNPSKPIYVQNNQNRPRDFNVPDANEHYTDHQQDLSTTKPTWMIKTSLKYKEFKNKFLIDELNRLDDQLMMVIEGGELLERWNGFKEVQGKIQTIFEHLLENDMRFCQQEHVEHYFWKILFYRVIELLRKEILESDEMMKVKYKERALETVDYGTKYLESLLKKLETRYKFQLEDYIGENAASFQSGLGFVGLALVSSQKIFLFLGDLARYREQINQTNNLGRAKNFYMKAQQVVPKNGRPFNQLALLAVYSKRKIDAVYFYMRSLMSSNPFQPAKESLVALFDEIRKKYEVGQRKREEKNRLRLKEKEHRFDGNLRKETWIHPEDGCRVHRTAPLDPSMIGPGDSSDDEELQQMDPSELNKRFVISFLHVQGKLITRIGMDSFQTCAILMLREFRALLHISPITINSHRLLQLISLNMYAISCNELKGSSSTHDASLQARSEVQECAIAVGLLMFGIILERFIEVLKESLNIITPVVNLSSDLRKSVDNDTTKDNKSSEPKKILTLNEDSKVMLPAIKAWCDWMMFQVKVWNPPPFCSDYKIGIELNKTYDLYNFSFQSSSAISSHDPWNGLATLMTLLETIVDTNKDYLSLQREKDYKLVRLQEDVTLAGFTPLKNYTPDPIFCRCDIDIEIAENALRMQKLKYFGMNFLCEDRQLDQKILKKIITPSGRIEYVSIVQNRTESASDTEILIESFSDEDNEDDSKKVESNGKSRVNESLDLKSHHDAAEIRRLLRRKDELERKQKMEEKYNERLQDILSQSTVALHIEVHPRYLIPDTNCFVDDLISIKAIASAHPLYQLMIPITVINELEGLSRGIKPLTPTAIVVSSLSQHSTPSVASSRIGNRNDPQHAAFVAKASKDALTFLKSKNPAVKCVTTKGSMINSAIFTSEDGPNEHKSNDDKILDTALNLCKKNVEEKKGEVRHLVREVVLLTTDRNLRVKALTNDIPVRELPDFIKWAGLGTID
ncbi:CLUMA_CG010028, isoform B [Clunio marinus]|uniref:CLUMA_CG010028, isoform B n=1 Tax=Clunio marinus TaxID=568069 RepID=A0A1J1IED8_9DIPT|nr:CLUMA_CG010028, isoform B [Clunio marinus]